MNEMLGNQYFLARNYAQAQEELESALLQYPSSVPIKKKLVICHIQTHSIRRALELFIEVITQDIHSIIDTDPIFENCPCPQLVLDIENSIVTTNDDEKNLMLGMLWLYCDIVPSYKHFKAITKPDDKINQIIAQLQLTIQQLKPTRNV
ncbi:MAG: tetratricopeptide repeat protein [Bacteroidota bacterium]